MKQGIARSIERRQAAQALAAVLSSFGGPTPRETSLLPLSAFGVKNVTLHNIASAQILDRPRFCSSTHAPNCTCTCSCHQ